MPHASPHYALLVLGFYCFSVWKHSTLIATVQNKWGTENILIYTRVLIQKILSKSTFYTESMLNIAVLHV